MFGDAFSLTIFHIFIFDTCSALLQIIFLDSEPTPIFEQENYAKRVARKIYNIDGMAKIPMFLIVESNTRGSAFNIIRSIQSQIPLISIVTDRPRADKIRRIGVETTSANKGQYLDTFITKLMQGSVTIAKDFCVMTKAKENEIDRRKEMLECVGNQLRTIRRDGSKWSGKYNCSGKPDRSVADDTVMALTILIRNSHMLYCYPDSYIVSTAPVDSMFSLEY